MTSIDALQYVFPEELLKFFTIKTAQIKKDKGFDEEYLEVCFEENNELPEGYLKSEYEAKDFISKEIQDFPLRGRAVFLIVKRRRWRHKQTGKTIMRDFTFLTEGTKFTAELAAFLKERS